MKKLGIGSEIFTRGVEDIITGDELARLVSSGRRMRIKLGIDATSPDLHIGHACSLWKIRALQERGHKAVIILGEFTTRIGDPTDKSLTRPILAPELIRKNIAGLKRQVGKILLTDPNVYELRSNAEWFGKMKTEEFLKLCAMVTHSRLIERDMFRERIRAHKEITIAEMLYPILQGYDSVMIEDDLTIIGSDQLFNEHMGRFFQERFGQPAQAIVTLTILPGLDGGSKMSKSLGNYIALNDTPEDKFGKAMRLLDSLIIPYLEVYTDMPMEQVRSIEEEMGKGMNPRDAKLIFAETMVKRYHGERIAQKTREQFLAVFSKKELPEGIREFRVHSDNPIEVLVETKFASSKSEARRLLKQGGVEVDGNRMSEHVTKLEHRNGVILRVGKRKIVRLLFS